MTASKPPDKTLVGMPADLKAVLQKLDQASADKAALLDKPTGAGFGPNQAHMGNAPGQRPRSAPPPLPANPDARPRTAAVAPVAAPHAAASMDRTLIGMPSDLQAALQRALAEQASAPVPTRPAPQAAQPAPPRPQPSAAGPVLRAQPVRAIGAPSTLVPQAQVSSHSPREPAHNPPPTAAPAYASGLGYQGGPSAPERAQPATINVLAPQAPLDWPPAALSRSQAGAISAPANEPSTPYGATEAAFAPYGSAAAEPRQGEPLLGMDTLDVSGLSDETSAQEPRLALLTADNAFKRNATRAAASPKRWLAISLIVLAVIAFASVIALRAPQVLPRSLAALLAPGSSSSDSAAPMPVPVTSAPVLPSSPAGQLITDTSAATAPAKLSPTPTPARPPSASATTSGASAQLEKKAVERLIANDYAGAKQLYENLRVAEPTRLEFSTMVELLNRSGAASGAQP